MIAAHRNSDGWGRARGAWRAVLALAVLAIAALSSFSGEALALKAIVVGPDQGRLEITTLGELYEGRGDSLQVETAAGEDGVVGRMSVGAATQGTNPNWIVFALTNPTDKPVERWLSADRYNVVGSGVVWPDLDARRIEAVTPSIGFVPERIKSDRADVFRITLEPGQTITYVAELSSERFARIYLWKPLDYELKSSDRQLFNGVMLGLTGLMAIFLTAIFAANHKLVFPASALVAWCVLAYLCVDFGFFHKLFQMKPEANAVYRAAAESALAASLVVFLHVYLRLALWHGLIRMLITVWLLAQFSLIAVAIVDPRLAATFARLSFIFIGGTGAGLILYLALRGQDRALSLIPTWILFLVWIFGAGVTLTGRLSGDIVVSGLVAGLVLVLLLIGFTVTQYAFRSLEPMYSGAPSELQLKSIAVDAAGAAVWEWNARRDSVKCSPLVEGWLGLHAGELSARVDEFMRHLHQADRERFRLALASVQERGDGRIHCDFRMRQADNSYRWFELEAAGVPGTDPRAFKCVGLMRDVTDTKRAHERLLHDAVHDSLTGLPNKELILDRLEVAMTRAKSEPHIRPAVISINIDKFKSMNSSFGLVLGDSLLLTIARRLQRHLGPNDTLARISGDQFAILVPAEQPPQELAAHAERIRRSLRSPIKIAAQEIVLTGSLGVAVYDGTEAKCEELLKKAEVAMYRAKRGGADRIEVFGRQMKADWDERVALESDLRKALEKNQLRVLYQPIVYLPTEELAGFEAVIRWDHPQLGVINPSAFVSIAEDSDLVVKLGSHVLMRASRDAARWQKEHPRAEAPLFVSVNVASRQLFRQDLIQEIRHILGRNVVPKGSLKLEVSEQLAMENPEQATEILEWLRGAGAEIALDDFGTGFSSFAYLERLPFDTIKIDQALMQSSSANGGSPLVRSIVALAHELGKKVVAKGVEGADDIAFLRSIGCEYAQGAYCGDPIPEGEVVQVLKMLRRSESKLKPRGLFRTKPKKKREAKADTGVPQGEVPVAKAANGSLPPPRPAAASAGPQVPDGREQRAVVRSLPNSAVRVRTRAQPQHQPQFQPQQQIRGQVAGGPAPALSLLPSPAVAAVPAVPPLPPNPLVGVSANAPPRETTAPPMRDPMPPQAPPHLRPVEQPAPVPPMPPPLPAGPPAMHGPMPPAWPHQPGVSAPPLPPQPVQVSMPAPPNGQMPPAPQRMPPPNAPPPPDFSGLPPAIAESLARLAGSIKPPSKKSPESA